MTISDVPQALRGVAPRALDAGVALVVAAAMTLTITVAREPEAARSPDVLAYLLGLSVAALVFARRRWPSGVLIGSVGALLVYYGLDYPAFPPAVPLAAAAYFAAVAGQIVAAGVVLTGVVIFGAAWQTLGEGASPASVLGLNTLADAALFAAVLLLGEAVRSRRAWAHEVGQRVRRAEEDREREAARRVADERLRIARELHDVMAHTVAALNVHAGVAADVIDDDPERAKAALRTIREQSRVATAELKATVGVLRAVATDAPSAPAPGLAGLDALVQPVREAGVAVDVAIAGAVRPLPGAIDLTAYRLLQESLTNVVRHAHATVARVLVCYECDGIVVQVEDDGAGPGRPEHGAGGYGLAGMHERAAAVGGTLNAGPIPGGGFRVHARLPTT